MGEARRMAFREAIFAEPLDLIKAALGEFRVVAAGNHARDHLVVQRLDGAAAAEGGHGVAQLIDFLGAEFSGDHGELHGLLLEERHALGFAEHRAELIRGSVLRGGGGIVLRLQPVAAAQIGMHHVALNRPRPDDGDLDDEVIKTARLEAR
ncbi:hypothetical protein MnTg02_01217 [bacterium MnTg02]|nr:hypothetical protein MnTg02_01217 [bacterium MnTg02]